MQQPWSVGGKDERVDKQLGKIAQRNIWRNMLGSYERKSGKIRLVHTEWLLFLSVFNESVEPPGTWALKRWWKDARVDKREVLSEICSGSYAQNEGYVYISYRDSSPPRILNYGCWLVRCISLEALVEGWTGGQTTRTKCSEDHWAKYARVLCPKWTGKWKK